MEIRDYKAALQHRFETLARMCDPEKIGGPVDKPADIERELAEVRSVLVDWEQHRASR
jgi:hypothetical protein